MSQPRTPQSDYLIELGRRVLKPYTELPNCRAAMITGSAAEGISDNYSDLDTTVYYEGTLPDDATLVRIHKENGAAERVWVLGDRAENSIVEAYELNGIQVQIGHTTLDVWEHDIAEVLDKFEADTPLQKAMSGTLESVAVYGDAYMNAWQDRIRRYPDGLRRAMVEKHLQFFPYWNVQALLGRRDAVVWHYQILVESSFKLVAVLAGLNRLYFTTFQFKKMHRLLAQMKIIPENFGERIEALFAQEPAQAADALEQLVREVVLLVEQEMPEIDTARVNKQLGARRQPWQMP